MNWKNWTPRELAALCFVQNGGQLLLIRKKRGLGAGKINAPGGRIEPGETALEAAIRETREEVGVVPRSPEKRGELHFQFVDGYSLHCTVFLAQGCDGRLCETDEALPLWTPIGAIPFHEMWRDDALWLPLMIGGKCFRGYFEFDGETMLSHRVEVCEFFDVKQALAIPGEAKPADALIAGCGFVGEAAARMLRAGGWNVAGVTRSVETPAHPAAAPKVFKVACDISDREIVKAKLGEFEHIDVIVDCVSSGHGGVAGYRRNYFDGARNLLEILRPQKFLFTSSTSVYGQTDGSWVTEESPAEPVGEPARILRETEGLVLRHGGIVARLAGIYGPGRSARLQKFLDGTAVTKNGGTRWINQIHRDDAAGAICFLLDNAAVAGIYNVTDDSPLRQIECHRWLAAHFKKPLPPSGPIGCNSKSFRGVTNKRVSNAKLRALGWHCIYPSFQDAVMNDTRLISH